MEGVSWNGCPFTMNAGGYPVVPWHVFRYKLSIKRFCEHHKPYQYCRKSLSKYSWLTSLVSANRRRIAAFCGERLFAATVLPQSRLSLVITPSSIRELIFAEFSGPGSSNDQAVCVFCGKTQKLRICVYREVKNRNFGKSR